MDIVPGMKELSIKGKLRMLNVYLPEHFDIVKGSLACFNIGLRGSTEEDDYGGIYLEAVNPEIEILWGDRCNGRGGYRANGYQIEIL